MRRRIASGAASTGCGPGINGITCAVEERGAVRVAYNARRSIKIHSKTTVVIADGIGLVLRVIEQVEESN